MCHHWGGVSTGGPAWGARILSHLWRPRLKSRRGQAGSSAGSEGGSVPGLPPASGHAQDPSGYPGVSQRHPSLPLSSQGGIRVCLPDRSLLGTPVMGLGPTPTWCDLSFTQLPQQRPLSMAGPLHGYGGLGLEHLSSGDAGEEGRARTVHSDTTAQHEMEQQRFNLLNSHILCS